MIRTLCWESVFIGIYILLCLQRIISITELSLFDSDLVVYRICTKLWNSKSFPQLTKPQKFKHEYLRSRASRCLSLSSSSSSSVISSNSTIIEILVLISWIPASKNFCFRNRLARNYSEYNFNFLMGHCQNISYLFSAWSFATSHDVGNTMRLYISDKWSKTYSIWL